MTKFFSLFIGVCLMANGEVLTATIHHSGANPHFSYDPKAVHGHVPVFSLTPEATKPVLTGVPHQEADDFIFEQLHLHFYNSTAGSEHTINGKYFPAEVERCIVLSVYTGGRGGQVNLQPSSDVAELQSNFNFQFHLVHYKKIYGSFLNAKDKPDGLSVIAVFVQDLMLQRSHLHVMKLIMETEETNAVGSRVSLSVNPKAFLPANKNFFTYKGSLTTPGCQESVTWIVMKTPISVPSNDMVYLHQMEDLHGEAISLHGNCRPQVAFGTRTLEANFNYVG